MKTRCQQNRGKIPGHQHRAIIDRCAGPPHSTTLESVPASEEFNHAGQDGNKNNQNNKRGQILFHQRNIAESKRGRYPLFWMASRTCCRSFGFGVAAGAPGLRLPPVMPPPGIAHVCFTMK